MASDDLARYIASLTPEEQEVIDRMTANHKYICQACGDYELLDYCQMCGSVYCCDCMFSHNEWHERQMSASYGA